MLLGIYTYLFFLLFFLCSCSFFLTLDFGGFFVKCCLISNFLKFNLKYLFSDFGQYSILLSAAGFCSKKLSDRRSFCMDFACRPPVCVSFLDVLASSLNCPWIQVCCIFYFYFFVLGNPLLSCDGLKTCPGCILPFAQGREHSASLQPCKIQYLYKGWSCLLKLKIRPACYSHFNDLYRFYHDFKDILQVFTKKYL